MATSKKLVIVESPAKAKTIGKYLGDDYEVMASVGHVRDLAHPRDLSPAMKKGPAGKFGIDIENDFEPIYVTTDRGKKTVADLKRAAKTASEIVLATDEDREGEAIAWHLLEVLKPKVPVTRMVFHEITPESIAAATEQTRDLDVALVDAQETRRILDRLYGFEVSPVLWRRVSGAKSAGRVQSPALKLIVDRELERRAFVSGTYADIHAQATTAKGETFTVSLTKLDAARVASGRDFSESGELTSVAVLLSEADANVLAAALNTSDAGLKVSKVEAKPYTRRPAAPFTTSTLQQEAGRKLRFSAQQTMSIAQGLYENGHITYMRTDSVSLSGQAVTAARNAATALYGQGAVPAEPRLYKGKSKNAQEAHEAVRPAGEAFPTPSQLSSVLRSDELKLYDLIWKRTVASQMVDAKGETVTATLEANPLPPLEGLSFSAADFSASGHGTERARVPPGVPRRQRRRGFGRPAGEREGSPPTPDDGRGLRRCVRGDGQSTRYPAACPIHRGQPGESTRRKRHWSTFDLCLHHFGHHRPRIRGAKGNRPGSAVDRFSRDPIASREICGPGRL